MWIINQENLRAYNKKLEIEIFTEIKKKNEYSSRVYSYLTIHFTSIGEKITILDDTFHEEDIKYLQKTKENKWAFSLCDIKKVIDFVENIILKQDYLYLHEIQEMYDEFKNKNMED